MTRRRIALLSVVLACCVLIAGSVMMVVAQSPTPSGNVRVGVILSLRGEINRYCLELPAGANGLDALEATGVDVGAQRGPLGAAICRVQNVGCTPPADTCFCQCQGNRCNYWAYYYQDEGNWQYSVMGAMNRKLSDGAVDGWLWSESATNTNMTPVGALPEISFEEICASPAANAAASTSEIDSATLFGYLLFGVLAVGLGGVLLWQRRAKRSR